MTGLETGIVRAACRLACVAVVAVGSGFASAAPKQGDATEAIRRANVRLGELLSSGAAPGSVAERDVAARLAVALRSVLDVGGLARRALAQHWGAMSQAERDDLVGTLQKLVERSYLDELRSHLAYEVDYTGETPQGEDVVVTTIVKAKRSGRTEKVAIDYLVHRDGERWRIEDVVVDDSSMVRNYRSQFNRIIAKEGVGGLLQRMHKKLRD